MQLRLVRAYVPSANLNNTAYSYPYVLAYNFFKSWVSETDSYVVLRT